MAPCRSRSSRALVVALQARGQGGIGAQGVGVDLRHQRHQVAVQRHLGAIHVRHRLREQAADVIGETNTVSRMGWSWQCRATPALRHSRRPHPAAASCTAACRRLCCRADRSAAGWSPHSLPLRGFPPGVRRIKWRMAIRGEQSSAGCRWRTSSEPQRTAWSMSVLMPAAPVWPEAQSSCGSLRGWPTSERAASLAQAQADPARIERLAQLRCHYLQRVDAE